VAKRAEACRPCFDDQTGPIALVGSPDTSCSSGRRLESCKKPHTLKGLIKNFQYITLAKRGSVMNKKGLVRNLNVRLAVNCRVARTNKSCYAAAALCIIFGRRRTPLNPGPYHTPQKERTKSDFQVNPSCEHDWFGAVERPALCVLTSARRQSGRRNNLKFGRLISHGQLFSAHRHSLKAGN
jgi:hypothetical protein